MTTNKNNITEIVENLENASVNDILSIITKLQDKWGISVSQMNAGVSTSSESNDAASVAPEEKTEFNVVLKAVPATAKMKVMLFLKKNLSLNVADIQNLLKDVVNGPVSLLTALVDKAEAEAMVKSLKDIGADADIK